MKRTGSHKLSLFDKKWRKTWDVPVYMKNSNCFWKRYVHPRSKILIYQVSSYDLNGDDLLGQRSRKEGVFEDNFSYFSSKPYVVTPNLNRLDETVQMRCHNICLCRNKKKISLILTKYSLLSRALLGT